MKKKLNGKRIKEYTKGSIIACFVITCLFFCMLFHAIGLDKMVDWINNKAAKVWDFFEKF